MHVREPPQPPFPEAKPSNIPLKQRQLRTVKVLELSAVCRFQAVGSCESAAPRPLRHTCSLAVQRVFPNRLPCRCSFSRLLYPATRCEPLRSVPFQSGLPLRSTLPARSPGVLASSCLREPFPFQSGRLFTSAVCAHLNELVQIRRECTARRAS